MIELGALGAKALLFGAGFAARFRRGAGGGWEEPVELCNRTAAGPPAQQMQPEPAATGRPQGLGAPVENPPDWISDRLPLEAEQALIDIGMPPCRSWSGVRSKIYDRALRAPDTHDDAAHRFVTWLRATEQAGEYRVDRVRELYVEFCEQDHRQPAVDNHFLAALKKTKGVRYQQLDRNNCQRTYTISAARTVAVAKRACGKPRKGRKIEPQRIMTAQVIDLGEAASQRMQAKAARSKALRRKQRARASKREAA